MQLMSIPAALLVLAALLASATATAQLGLPGTGLSLPQPVGDIVRPLDQTLTSTATALDARVQTTLRALQVRELIRTHPDLIEADSNGAPIVRGRVLALAPTPSALLRLQQAGFTIVEQRTLAGLDLEWVVIAPPAGLSTRAALRKLRRLDPDGSYDFNHIYTESGAAEERATAAPAAAVPAVPATAPIGLIDGGIDQTHSVFRDHAITVWGCDGASIPAAHGTAVASLLIGAGGSVLYAADVYCGKPIGGAVDAIAAACGWLAQAQVPVINISLVGPPNVLLERVVQTLTARGHLVVAAVGNDGPAAPPLYPAAYAEVIGVTGVDARNRVLIEAGRGAQVDFSAPAADMVAATLGGQFAPVRGTSFAAPIVAGLLATRVQTVSRAAAEQAQRELAAQAIDLGASGPDRVYGRGLVGAGLRAAAAH